MKFPPFLLLFILCYFRFLCLQRTRSLLFEPQIFSFHYGHPTLSILETSSHFFPIRTCCVQCGRHSVFYSFIGLFAGYCEEGPLDVYSYYQEDNSIAENIYPNGNVNLCKRYVNFIIQPSLTHFLFFNSNTISSSCCLSSPNCMKMSRISSSLVICYLQ